MTVLRLLPGSLSGTVRAPSSKSMGHRELIAAALTGEECLVENISMSKDIEATAAALAKLGASVSWRTAEFTDRQAASVGGKLQSKGPSVIDCGESGSTLRFLLPLAAFLGAAVEFSGSGKLNERPLDPMAAIFREQGINWQQGSNGNFPLRISGQLRPGKFSLPGDVSSQFISGLLFVLPLLPGPSIIVTTSPAESLSYVDLTVSCLRKHGITVDDTEPGVWRTEGGQSYRGNRAAVEGDYSQGAFWLTAGALNGKINCAGLQKGSLQGDRVIVQLLKQMGAKLVQGTGQDGCSAEASELTGITIDAGDCPDLVPVLAVAGAVAKGTTRIVNAARVRLKESDRLHAMTVELRKLGACIEETPDSLFIQGVAELSGGTVESWNDHRIAMALAVSALKCREPLIIRGAECVQKSYPLFWQDFQALGGKIEQCTEEEDSG